MGKGYLKALALAPLLCFVACAPTLPEFTHPNSNTTVWLDQNWTAQQREWFHHADQGTQTVSIPLEWLKALQQPYLFSSASFIDPAYLDRFGFINANETVDGIKLPVGFAVGLSFRDANGAPVLNPITHTPWKRVGYTCAACHTGRIEFNGTTYFIDGAPAMTNLSHFQEHLGLALLYTKFIPWRRSTFEAVVLGPNASSEAKSTLMSQVDAVLAGLKVLKDHETAVSKQSVEEGYGRLDALNRIGNTVFALDFGEAKDDQGRLYRDINYAPESAPVHFPRIWDTSWFAWVQYDGSIQQPMVRNAGESLGVDAWVDLTGSKQTLLLSDSKISILYEMETQLAGNTAPTADHQFHGLTAPRWPDSLPRCANTDLSNTECVKANVSDELYWKRVAHGAKLYDDLCKGCHLPPITKDGFWDPTQTPWSAPLPKGGPFLDLKMEPIDQVGTDDRQAAGLADRKVSIPVALHLPDEKNGSGPFGPVLGDLVANVVTYWYDHQSPPVSSDMRTEMNGCRPNGIRSPLAYKVRPLDGIWATPPYLHNGTVPTVFAVLSPAKERPSEFCLGHRDYDPLKMGLKDTCHSGDFHLVTTDKNGPIPGNANTGHEFSDTYNSADPGKSPKGVIGPALSVEDRLDLIEYLKRDEVNGNAPGPGTALPTTALN